MIELYDLKMFVGGIAVWGLAIAVAALLGVFDDRRNDGYRFRAGRFVAVMALSAAALSAASVYGGYKFATLHGKSIIEGLNRAAVAVAIARYSDAHVQDLIKTAFPGLVGSEDEACAKAAISNYIEDQWNRAFYEEACKSGPGLCASSEEAFARKVRMADNPLGIALLDTTVLGNIITHRWKTGSNLSMRILSYQKLVTPLAENAGSFLGADEDNYREYRRYFEMCADIKPQPWISVSAPLIVSPASFCFGRCP